MPKRRYGAGPAADHGYATSGRQPHQGVHQKKTSKDHPYATVSGANIQNEAMDTPPLSLVSSEHSYGTRLKITEDTYAAEMGGSNSRDRRYDHPYSAWKNPNPSTHIPPSLPPMANSLGWTRPTGTKVKKLLGVNRFLASPVVLLSTNPCNLLRFSILWRKCNFFFRISRERSI